MSFNRVIEDCTLLIWQSSTFFPDMEHIIITRWINGYTLYAFQSYFTLQTDSENFALLVRFIIWFSQYYENSSRLQRNRYELDISSQYIRSTLLLISTFCVWFDHCNDDVFSSFSIRKRWFIVHFCIAWRHCSKGHNDNKLIFSQTSQLLTRMPF